MMKWIAFATLVVLAIASVVVCADDELPPIPVDCISMDRLQQSYEALRKSGEYHVARGDYESALPCYEAAAQTSTKFGNAWGDLAAVQQKLGQTTESIDSFKKCIRWTPKNYACHANMGNAYRELRMLDEALVAFQKALELRPADAAILNNLGILQYEKGDFQKSLEAFSKSLEHDPKSAEAHYNMANIYRDHFQLQDAIRKYRLALQLAPGDTRAMLNLGICYQDLGQFTDAASTYDALAELLQERVKQQAGVAARRDTISFLVDTYYNAGNARYKAGQLEEARSTYLRSLSTAKGMLDDQSRLADTMANIARIDRDLSQWEHSAAGFVRAMSIAKAPSPFAGEAALALMRVGNSSSTLVRDFANTTVHQVRDEVTPRWNDTRKEFVITASLSVRTADIQFLTDAAEPLSGAVLRNASTKFISSMRQKLRRIGLAPFFETSLDQDTDEDSRKSEDDMKGPLRIGVLLSGSFPLSSLSTDTSSFVFVCYQRNNRMQLQHIDTSFCSEVVDLSSLSIADAANRMNHADLSMLWFSAHPSETELSAELLAMHTAPVQVYVAQDALTVGLDNLVEYKLAPPKVVDGMLSVANASWTEKIMLVPYEFSKSCAISESLDSLSASATVDVVSPMVRVGLLESDRRYYGQAFYTEVLPHFVARINHTIDVSSQVEVVLWASDPSFMYKQRDHERLSRAIERFSGIPRKNVRFITDLKDIPKLTVCLDGFPVASPTAAKRAAELGCPLISVHSDMSLTTRLTKSYEPQHIVSKLSEVAERMATVALQQAAVPAFSQAIRCHVTQDGFANDKLIDAMRIADELRTLGASPMHILVG